MSIGRTLCITALLLLCANRSQADCLDPHRQGVESDGLVTRLNAYKSESQLCITPGFLRENDCAACKDNYIHRCTNGGWTPTYKACSSEPSEISDTQQGSDNSRIDMEAALQRLRDQRDAQQSALARSQQADHGILGSLSSERTPRTSGTVDGYESVQPRAGHSSIAAEVETACPGIDQELQRHAQACERRRAMNSSGGMCQTYKQMEQCFREASSTARRCSHPAMDEQAREFDRVAQQARQNATQVCSE